MEVRFTPEMEKKLADLAAQTGRGVDELVRQVVAGYVNDLATARSMLDNRYDDLKSGRVDLIDGAEAFARLGDKSKNRRSGPA